MGGANEVEAEGLKRASGGGAEELNAVVREGWSGRLGGTRGNEEDLKLGQAASLNSPLELSSGRGIRFLI